MAHQQPGTFDRAAFIAAVRKAIDAAAPKNLEEADDFKGSGKVAGVKDEVGDLVKGGKKDAEKDIKGATDAAPDASKATPKQVVPMKPEEPGAPSATVGAAGAMPGPRPPQETDLSQGPAEVDREMHDANVTEEQLQKSNEPEFTGALAARQDAKEHAATAPAGYRAQEQEVLAKGRTEAQLAEGMHLKGMHGAKLAAIRRRRTATRTRRRPRTRRSAQRSPPTSRGSTTAPSPTSPGSSTGSTARSSRRSRPGEATARKHFEDYVGEKMDAYKDDRYDGLLGGAKWLKDKLFGMPDEVNVFYAQGRDQLPRGDGRGDRRGRRPRRRRSSTSARLKIAKGRAEVHDYVTQLPKDLQKVGKDAEGKLGQQLEPLSADVDSKQDALVDDDRAEVRRLARRARLADRRDEGRQPRPRRQGARRRRRRRQDDPQAQGHAPERPRQGGGRDRRHHLRPDRLPRQPRRRRQVGPEPVRRQHRHPPQGGLLRLALRRARRRRHQAEELRPRPGSSTS